MPNHERSQLPAPEAKRARQRPVPAKVMEEALVEKPAERMKTARELVEMVQEMKQAPAAERMPPVPVPKTPEMAARIAAKEDMARTSAVREKIQREPSEQDRIQGELGRVLQQEESYKHHLERLRSAQGLGIRNWWSRVLGKGPSGDEKKIARLEEQVHELEAKRNQLEEDFQMAGYERAIKETAGRGRGAAITPKRVIEQEAQAREGRLIAEKRYGRATEKSAEELEEEYLGEQKEEEPVDTSKFAKTRKHGAARMMRDTAAGILPVETSSERDQRQMEEREGIPVPVEEQTNIEEFEKSLEEDVFEAKKKEQQENVKRMKPMTIERAQEILPEGRAHEMWEEIDVWMKALEPEERKKIAISPTEYVFIASQYVEALKNKDAKLEKLYRSQLDGLNKALKVPKGYDPIEGSGKSPLKNAKVLGGNGRARASMGKEVGKIAGARPRV